MTQSVVQVDAFTDRAFGGNPAAVCVLPVRADDVWMQNVAAEMQLSETAFVLRTESGFTLRWFTPTTEVDLCGHATLAAAHVLWTEGHVADGTRLRFSTRSGELRAARDGDRIVLDLPAQTLGAIPCPPGLATALGATPVAVAGDGVTILAEMASAQAVRILAPDIGRLLQIPDAVNCIVTARSDDSRHDFVSRFFAPAIGIPEDPVTGSAHCALATYWSPRLGLTEMTAHQASARGGELHVRLDGDRVHVGGRAVTVLRGELDTGPW